MNLKSKTVRKVAVVLAGCALTAAGCSDFLSVQDPGRYTDEALNTPIALAAVANGVEGDLTAMLSGSIVWTFGLMSDEFMHTGTWNPDDDIDEGRAPILPNGGPQSGFLARRTAAQKAQERFQQVMGDTANRSVLMARVVAVEGWANLWMGMYNCESPKAPLGEIVSDIEMYKVAIPVLTKAIELAQAAKSVNYERMAMGGRARANLFAGNFDAALADAKTIPDDYVFTSKYTNSGSGTSNYVVNVAYRGRNKAAGIDSRLWSRVDTIAGFMKDPWTGALDKRLPVTHPRNERGADGVTQHYNEEMYRDPGDDIVMVSGLEMRLIEAEVYYKKGDLVNAMERINYVRKNGYCYTCADKSPANLAPLPATTNANQVRDYLLQERLAQLFLQGQRQNDLYRYNLGATVLGPNRPMKYGLDSSEITLNPHTNGSLTGRCLPKS